jgi:hypothetical protein
MTNPTLRDASALKVVAVARQTVTYQIGLPAGCQRMIRTWSPLLNNGLELKSVFEDYMTQLNGLPIGSERLQMESGRTPRERQDSRENQHSAA